MYCSTKYISVKEVFKLFCKVFVKSIKAQFLCEPKNDDIFPGTEIRGPCFRNIIHVIVIEVEGSMKCETCW